MSQARPEGYRLGCGGHKLGCEGRKLGHVDYKLGHLDHMLISCKLCIIDLRLGHVCHKHKLGNTGPKLGSEGHMLDHVGHKLGHVLHKLDRIGFKFGHELIMFMFSTFRSIWNLLWKEKTDFVLIKRACQIFFLQRINHCFLFILKICPFSIHVFNKISGHMDLETIRIEKNSD